MRKFAIIAAVAVQLVVLGWMAGEREWVVRTGQTVFLRTAPIDPRDPMRGDYVRLVYEIATVPKRLCRAGVVNWFSPQEDIFNARTRDRRVYAEIRLDEEGVVELVSLSDEPPAQGLYLRGRADAIYLSTIRVRFGVEAFFMQQGDAMAFENKVRNEMAGVPLNMELAVSSKGLAVLKGYRWEPLGITVVLKRNETTPTVDPDRRGGLRGVTVELKNHGTTPQAIVDGAGAQTFRLISADDRTRSEDETGWIWVGEDARPRPPIAANLIVLKPGETHRLDIDFTRAEWFVRKVEKTGLGPAKSLDTFANDWTASFRIEYLPPSAKDCVGISEADLIRHVRLQSRRFNASGTAD